jgi:hypothetical protein
MPRRLAIVASLAVLGALTLGAAGARALIIPPTEWNVSLSGNQTVTWSFAAEQPEECTDYYGTTGEKAQGGGTVSMSFKTKTPIGAVTTIGGNGVHFSSFNTVGWTAPATFSKQGKFAVISGRPCNWAPGDELEPLSKILSNRDCGTEKPTADVAVSWSGGEFLPGAGVGGHLPYGSCPGVLIPDMKVLKTTGCLGSGMDDEAIEGTSLAPVSAAVPASKFTAGKKFSVADAKKYHCVFPSTWPDKGPLTVDINVSFSATLKPR